MTAAVAAAPASGGDNVEVATETDILNDETQKTDALTDDSIVEKMEQAEIEEASEESEDGTDSEVDSEYESTDSSDEEDMRYAIGNVPMKWYEDLEHAGYDLDGKRIAKAPTMDQLDRLTEKMSNPDFWKTIEDPLSGKKQALTDDEIAIIASLRKSSTVKTATSVDPHEPFLDIFSQDKMQTSLVATNEAKKSFIPSLLDKKKVGHLVHLIKTGKFKVDREKEEKKEKRDKEYYDIWGDFTRDDHKTKSQLARLKMAIPAPKAVLPGHEESYRPPPEFILDKDELEAWENEDDPKAKSNYLPEMFKSLRHVPGFSRFINDRFERCLDLYLCPRQRKMKMNVDPDSLIPKLPKPKDLMPFPMVEAVKFESHSGEVKTIALSQNGQFLASGDSTGQLKFWDVLSGKDYRTLEFGADSPITHVEWFPVANLKSICAVSAGHFIHFINSGLGDMVSVKQADAYFRGLNLEFHGKTKDGEAPSSDAKFQWLKEGENLLSGRRLRLKHQGEVRGFQFRASGSHIVAMVSGGGKSQVVIHNVSEQQSMSPFKSADGVVQSVAFHPTRPHLYVARQNNISVYDLQKLALTKTLQPAGQNLSKIAIHPSTGDHVLTTSHDNRSSWIDMDFSTKPYKIMSHGSAARDCAFHPANYPLCGIALDSGTIAIWHATVFTDLTSNPQLVPVRELKPFKPEKKLKCYSVTWHPTQPWILGAFSDGTVRLFS